MTKFTKKRLTLEEIVELIESKTNRVAKRCGGDFRLHCPAHEDKNPSLSVSEGDDGRILMCCFSGCSFDEILKAMGISASALAPKNNCWKRR